jgi:hypothetical protein
MAAPMKMRFNLAQPFAEFLADNFADAQEFEVEIVMVDLQSGKLEGTFKVLSD